jgi:hypothetical protein
MDFAAEQTTCSRPSTRRGGSFVPATEDDRCGTQAQMRDV